MLGAAFVMLGLGAGAGAILAAASKFFYVEVDARIGLIEDELPGANCGGCGFTGCGACAEGMVSGAASVTACIVGGPEVATRIAGILGGQVGFVEPKLARHKCTGGDRAERKFNYEGAHDCRTIHALSGGDLKCTYGCLGGGTCVEACTFGALKMGDDGLPEVIPDRCTGCGACAKVCPTGVITVEPLTEHLFHMAHDHECVAPCVQLCPAQIDIPGYIALAAAGKYGEAIDLIRERNPLALICGRVCPAPCEDGCRRHNIDDEPVHHNYIKRFVADWEMENGGVRLPSCLPDTGKKIAIIGGGPAGLTAAFFLRRMGHHPTILDAKPKLGGMLRYGIPEYRLPKAVLDAEIQMIVDMGTEVQYGKALGVNVFLEELESDYDAVLMALGAWGSSSLRCDGEDLNGVWKGTEYLEKREMGEHVDLKGKRVVVVGGGNTAMDAARSALRHGAAEVILQYRRTRAEMPANAVEIIAAEDEGVKYQFLSAPTRLLGDEDGNLRELEYITMELGEPDASGRRRPVPIEGSETRMPVDIVLAAIGQRALGDWFTDAHKERGLELTRWNTIEADPQTLQSGLPHVFTAGDQWLGPALLVDAVGTARRAARSIHLFLNGQPLDVPGGTFEKPTHQAVSDEHIVKGVAAQVKVVQPELEPEERIRSFVEVDLVVNAEQLQLEAARCMRCGTRCYFTDDALHEFERVKSPLEKAGDLLSNSPR